MIKRFLAWLTEGSHYDPKHIMENPIKGAIERKLNDSDHKELRYLHNSRSGKSYVADAAHYNHQDIADHVGEHGFKRNFEGEPTHYSLGHYRAGMIDHHNIERIKAHPKGLRGYIADAHKGLPEEDWAHD